LTAATRALSHTSPSPRLDAEILLSLALDKDRAHLRAWPEKQLSPEQHRQFQALLQQRLSGIPIAYITGHREFWSRDFEVTPDVLIPRPDTELLIELALALIPTDATDSLLDLGTGSGIIAITLAAERPHTGITATDISAKSLAVARRNAQKHSTNTIVFSESDWFDSLPYGAPFKLIISNPPYIDAKDPHLTQGDIRFEPEHALIAARQGLSAIETIADNARNYLSKPGHLLIEHGYNQQHAVQSIFKALNYQNIKTHKDLSGQARVTYGQYFA